MSRKVLAASWFVAIACPACHSGFVAVDDGYGPSASPSEAVAEGSASGTPIGPEGGQVVAAGARLIIPEGALDSSVVITTECRDGRAEGSLGVLCDFGPDGLQFERPVGVHLAVDRAPSEAYAKRLRVGTLVDGAWVPLEGSRYLPDVREVVAPTRHFSTYGILLAPCEAPDCDATDLATCEGPDCLPPELQDSWTVRMTAMLLPVNGDQAAADIPALPSVQDYLDVTTLSGSACLDLTGDGTRDSEVGRNVDKLGALWGGLPSSDITVALREGYWNLVLAFYAAPGPGEAPTRLSVWLAERDSATDDQGAPFHALGGVNNPLGDLSVSVSDRDFVASGGPVAVTYVLENVPFVFEVSDAVLSGTFVDTADGRFVRDGTLSGLLYRADVYGMLEQASAVCQTFADPPFECPFVDELQALVRGPFFSWDLDVGGCGRSVGDQPDCAAMSVCAYFAAEPAQIEVLVPGP